MRFVKASHATQPNLLTKKELSDRPTNNLQAERHLARFKKCTAVVKLLFTTKRVRKVCVLLLSNSLRNGNEKASTVSLPS